MENPSATKLYDTPDYIRFVDHPTYWAVKRECRMRGVPFRYWIRRQPCDSRRPIHAQSSLSRGEVGDGRRECRVPPARSDYQRSVSPNVKLVTVHTPPTSWKSMWMIRSHFQLDATACTVQVPSRNVGSPKMTTAPS